MSKPEKSKKSSTKMADSVTPMMAQYLELKASQQDALLFYRMGDFYELFFEDAVEAAAALDITLTKRGKHLGDDIPMCGVPVHAADAYHFLPGWCVYAKGGGACRSHMAPSSAAFW